jgi:hypothetical protein
MKGRRKTRTWTQGALALAIAAALAACGGDGGGGVDDNGDDPAPTLPATLAFGGGLVDGSRLVITVEGLVNLPISGFGFRGTWDRTANRYTLPANETALTTDLGPAGTLAARVTATAAWVGAVPPASSGTVSAQALAGSAGVPLFTGTASVTALSDTQVRLTWDGTAPPTTIDASWDGFIDGDLTTDWESGIQSAFGMLALGVEKVQLALDQFVFINGNDAALARAGAAGVSQACAGGNGSRKVVWNDANGDGALGPGDGFTVVFSGCVLDMPGDIDQRLDGRIVISNYLENASPVSVGGRVDFVALQQTETGSGGFSLSTSGSVQLILSAP